MTSSSSYWYLQAICLDVTVAQVYSKTSSISLDQKIDFSGRKSFCFCLISRLTSAKRLEDRTISYAVNTI